MRKIISLILLIVIILCSRCCYASSSITYFSYESIKIENKDIDILSYELTIDTKTSKIKNTILLKNTSNDEIKTNILLPLENKEISMTINNLKIKLNDVELEYTINNDGDYVVKTKIPANSGKKLEIEYFTDNDLQKAKIIKCNFDNLKERTVNKLKVNIEIDEKNIPLVENIYPGHYTFNENTISIEYYDYVVNTLTREVIVQKETFNNMLYGREENLTDIERDIVNNWYKQNTINYNGLRESGNIANKFCRNILDYLYLKNGGKFNYYNEPSEPLLYEMFSDKLINDERNSVSDLKGKKICCRMENNITI